MSQLGIKNKEHGKFSEYIKSRSIVDHDANHINIKDHTANKIIDAYNNGYEKGKAETYNNIIEKFSNWANYSYILIQEIISKINSEGFNVGNLYIKLTPSLISAKLSVNNGLILNDDFIKLAYEEIFISQDKYYNKYKDIIDISIIDGDHLQEDLLKADGYAYKE